jgi:uncharacterized peroxidase-related enzyme
MALLEYVDVEADDQRVRELFERDAETFGRPSLFARMLAHSPETLSARQEYATALREAGSLEPKLVELAYVTVSATNDCDYCVASHTEQLVEHVGLPEATVEAIVSGRATTSASDDSDEPASETRTEFTERETAVVTFARAVASDPKRVSGDDVDALRAVGFDDSSIVELVVSISGAVAANTITDTLNVLPADGAVAAYAPEEASE